MDMNDVASSPPHDPSLGASLGVSLTDSGSFSHSVQAVELRPDFRPENTGIAFDLHDVLVRFNLQNALRHITKMEGKKKVAKLLLNPRIAKKMFSGKVHIEQRLKEMVDEEKDPEKKEIMRNELQKIAYQVVNSHDFDPGTLSLVSAFPRPLSSSIIIIFHHHRFVIQC